MNEVVKIQQFRPTCLINCHYKLITKVLAIRIEPSADKLIHSAFMKGRNIMSRIMVMHEILHVTKRKKETGVVLKLDFKKYYDKVS